jgi:hypothetical protein
LPEETAVLLELVATFVVAAYFALLALGHALLAAEIYQCLRENVLDGPDRGDPCGEALRRAGRLPAGRWIAAAATEGRSA